LDSNVSIVPFKFKYLPSLLDMLEDRKFQGIETVNMKTLPKIGYIAMLNDQPIAAGFLRRVEGGYAQIDTLVTNPYFGNKLRHEGIDKVVNSLINDAKELRLRGILAITGELSILNRAEDKGFFRIDQQIIGLRL
jgi:hypothetical protein